MAGKNFKKHQRKGKRNGGGLGREIGTGLCPIPPRYPTKLHYFDIGTINAASTLLGTYGYRLNGLFDPDFTGTGIQPLYFDQMAALYSKYRVYAVDVIVEMSNETEETNMSIVVPSIANSIGTSPAAAATQRFARNLTLGPKSGGFGIKTVRFRVDLAKIWGVDQRALHSEDDFAALTTGNPGNVVYLWLATRNIGSTATIVRYSVRLVYHCDFHMPVIQPVS